MQLLKKGEKHPDIMEYSIILENQLGKYFENLRIEKSSRMLDRTNRLSLYFFE